MGIRKSAVLRKAIPIAVAAFLVAGGSRAEEPAPDSPPVREAPPSVGLDALLRLPSGPIPAAGEELESSDRQQWEERFADVRSELLDAQTKLSNAQSELEEIARDSESWQMAAPGAQHDPETSPISFKLRNEIRRYREEISRAERRLRELEVEASLAGVPPEWRRPPLEDAVPDS
jgi:hypothetical protein